MRNNSHPLMSFTTRKRKKKEKKEGKKQKTEKFTVHFEIVGRALLQPRTLQHPLCSQSPSQSVSSNNCLCKPPPHNDST